jgi:hypothetical protein
MPANKKVVKLLLVVAVVSESCRGLFRLPANGAPTAENEKSTLARRPDVFRIFQRF